MKHLWIAGLLCYGSISTAWAQHIDWGKLFDQDNSGNKALVDANRDQLLDHILPKLCEEDAVSATAEIPGLAQQLSRPEDRIRLDASGVLFGIAVSRRDSAVVLAPAFPALEKQVHDPVERIRHNVVSALALLQPGIPDRELSFLIALTASPDEKIAAQATAGVALMAKRRQSADDRIDQILIQSNSPLVLRAALQSLSTTHAVSPQIVKHLGVVLTNQNTEVVKEDLKLLAALGADAIRENHSPIQAIASNSTDAELRTLAEQCLQQDHSK